MKSWRGGIWLEGTSDKPSRYFSLERQSTELEDNAIFFENHHHLLALYVRDCWLHLTRLHEAWWEYCKDVYDLRNPILG